MKIVVKLFAGAVELAGVDQVEVEVCDAVTVGELRKGLLDVCPSLQPIMQHSLLAVDSTYASAETTVTADSEVALIPPVSGG